LTRHVSFRYLHLDPTYFIASVPSLLRHDRLVEFGKAKRLIRAGGHFAQKTRVRTHMRPGDFVGVDFIAKSACQFSSYSCYNWLRLTTLSRRLQ
jgi:hypothetical protein